MAYSKSLGIGLQSSCLSPYHYPSRKVQGSTFSWIDFSLRVSLEARCQVAASPQGYHDSLTEQAASSCLPLLCTGSQVGVQVGPRAVDGQWCIHSCNRASRPKGWRESWQLTSCFSHREAKQHKACWCQQVLLSEVILSFGGTVPSSTMASAH